MKKYFLGFCRFLDFKSHPSEKTYCASNLESWHIFCDFPAISDWCTETNWTYFIVKKKKKNKTPNFCIIRNRKHFSQKTKCVFWNLNDFKLCQFPLKSRAEEVSCQMGINMRWYDSGDEGQGRADLKEKKILVRQPQFKY